MEWYQTHSQCAIPSSKQLPCRTVKTLKEDLKKTLAPDLDTRMYRFLSRYRVTLQTTTCQTPAEMLVMGRPRFRLDLVYPALDNRVLDRQTNHCAGASRCSVVYEGDAVWVVNFAGIPRWLTGVLHTKLGPVSFTVGFSEAESGEDIWITSVSGFTRRVTGKLKMGLCQRVFVGLCVRRRRGMYKHHLL